MNYFFQNCYSLAYLNISKLITKETLYFISTFENCSSLKEIDLSNFDTAKANHRVKCFQIVNH